MTPARFKPVATATPSASTTPRRADGRYRRCHLEPNGDLGSVPVLKRYQSWSSTGRRNLRRLGRPQATQRWRRPRSGRSRVGPGMPTSGAGSSWFVSPDPQLMAKLLRTINALRRIELFSGTKSSSLSSQHLTVVFCGQILPSRPLRGKRFAIRQTYSAHRRTAHPRKRECGAHGRVRLGILIAVGRGTPPTRKL